MSERDKKLLIYLGALIILAAAYFLVGRPFLDKYDALSTENMQLQSELSRKQSAYNDKETIENGIKDANARIQEIMDEFPENNSDEKAIMFTAHAETDIPMWFTQVKFAEETKMMINGEEVESASDVEAANTQAAVDAAEGESSGDSVNSGAENVGEAASSGGATGINGLMWRDTELGLTFQTQYEGFKKYLAYIRDYDDRIVIKELDVNYTAESDMVGGNMVLSQYAVLGDDRVLPDVITGVTDFGTSNVFTNYNSGGTILDLLAGIASDFLNLLMGGLTEGAMEEVGIDYFVKLNACTENTNGFTIGRGDDVKGDTYITSADNKNHEVTFKVSGSGGKYKVEYTVGKTEYTDTISKAEDGKLYLRVVSTYRSGDDDKVSASLRVLNESNIPVVVGIEGDDPENPRVNVTEKSGEVTVNKK